MSEMSTCQVGSRDASLVDDGSARSQHPFGGENF
jgi:hypothetical protein